ncbi:hypothetical protein [Nitrospira sp. M1]
MQPLLLATIIVITSSLNIDEANVRVISTTQIAENLFIHGKDDIPEGKQDPQRGEFPPGVPSTPSAPDTLRTPDAITDSPPVISPPIVDKEMTIPPPITDPECR